MGALTRIREALRRRENFSLSDFPDQASRYPRVVFAVLPVVAAAACLGYLWSQESVPAQSRTSAGATQPAVSAKAAPAARLAEHVFAVPLGSSPRKGAASPKVTIVEFSDFECPFCAVASRNLGVLLERHRDEVAVVFKHLPLPFHEHAMDAARAAIAAHEQGKFWEMHDKLFKNRRALAPADLERYASELGLDVGRFKAALVSKSSRRRVAEDQQLATRLAVRGTPHFFVNGRRLIGDGSVDSLTAAVQIELSNVRQRLPAGAADSDVYTVLTKDGLSAAPPVTRQRPDEPASDRIFAAVPAGSPRRGATDPLVTLVQFGDFHCPFTRAVEPTLARLLREFDDELQIVWKDLPMPSHPHAAEAAHAGRAAQGQGKFWEMHRELLAAQNPMSREEIAVAAKRLGLDIERLRSVARSPATAATVAQDVALARQLMVPGTPTFFVNGKRVAGARSHAELKAAIEIERQAARKLVEGGVPRKRLYEEILSQPRSRARSASGFSLARATAGTTPAEQPMD